MNIWIFGKGGCNETECFERSQYSSSSLLCLPELAGHLACDSTCFAFIRSGRGRMDIGEQRKITGG